MKKLFTINFEKYKECLYLASDLSQLYSNSPILHIDYRLAEKIFAICSGGVDISRFDKVFDTLVSVNNKQNVKSIAGVGVKTFTINDISGSSMEKIQEFTAISGRGEFNNITELELIKKVSKFRNASIIADCKELGVNLSFSYYHCLVRSPVGVLIHQEPYELINIKKIKIISSAKNIQKNNTNTIWFTDGKNEYKYYRSKSVLYKKFDLAKHINSDLIKVTINTKIWEELDAKFEKSQPKKTNDIFDLYDISKLLPGEDYIVLPLYSSKNGNKYVESKSGINQWNALGRERKFGESYIPIPSVVRKNSENFFPPRNKEFELLLPAEHAYTKAKVCQDNGKALMTNPNTELCGALLNVIYPDITDTKLIDSKGLKPVSYDNLQAIGRDCVIIVKSKEKKNAYKMIFGKLGDYEEFLFEVTKYNKEKI